MYQLPQHPRSIWSIMGESVQLYKAAFGRLVFWAVIAGLLSVVSQLTLRSNINMSIPGANVSGDGLSLFMVLLPIVIIILTLVPFAAMIFDIHQTMFTKNPTIKTAFMVALRKWLPLIGAMILYLIMLFLIGVVIMLLSAVAKLMGIIVGGILMIYVVISVFAWHVLIVSENQGVIEALKNSFRLVKNNWWRTFALLFIMGFIIATINIILAFVFHSGIDTAGLASESALQLVITAIISMLFMPWLYGVMLLQVHDLELRKAKHDQYDKVLDKHD